LARHDAGDDDRSLAGEDEAKKQGRLSENEQGHQPVDGDRGEVLDLFEQKREDGGAGHHSIVVDKAQAPSRGSLLV
jgi:hypothetical protein